MQLHPFALFGSCCESRTPVGHPRTNTHCCPLWNCTWPVCSHPCVWQILQNQHSAGPDNQPLQLQIYRVNNTNHKAKRLFLSQVMCSYCWGPMWAEWVSQCCPPSGASCSNGACWESASQTSYHNSSASVKLPDFLLLTQKLAVDNPSQLTWRAAWWETPCWVVAWNAPSAEWRAAGAPGWCWSCGSRPACAAGCADAQRSNGGQMRCFDSNGRK